MAARDRDERPDRARCAPGRSRVPRSRRGGLATPGWRLLDDLAVTRDAAGQMAVDHVLLQEVARGAPPVLRLYRWSPPALSLGRFQSERDVDRAACARLGVEVVRRPTGGRALLHGGDLTYAVAMPRPAGAAGSVAAVHALLAGALIGGLARLGVRAAVVHGGEPPGAACFTGCQGADLRVGAHKLCGSAQLQRDGAVLQHGAVLLERLPFDETDLLAARDPSTRAAAARRLREVSVTLAELGAPHDARTVARALVGGFAARLDVQLEPRPPVDVQTRLPYEAAADSLPR